MSVLEPEATSISDAFGKAWQTLTKHPGALLIPFAMVHTAELLPEWGWEYAKLWLGERADEGKLQSTLFGLVADPLQLLLGLSALFVLVLLVVAAYSYGFAKVIAYLRGSAPDYRGVTSSLGWFGLVLLLPYALFAIGALAVLIPLLKGSGFEWSMIMPMLVCFTAAIVLGVLVQPLFFSFIGPGVQSNAFGLAAFRQVLARIRAKLPAYVALALAMVATTIAISLVHRLFNKLLPSAPGGDVSQILNGNLSAESLYKALFLPEARPTWASIVANVVDIALDSARDAYFSLVVLYWYLRKD